MEAPPIPKGCFAITHYSCWDPKPEVFYIVEKSISAHCVYLHITSCIRDGFPKQSGFLVPQVYHPGEKKYMIVFCLELNLTCLKWILHFYTSHQINEYWVGGCILHKTGYFLELFPYINILIRFYLHSCSCPRQTVLCPKIFAVLLGILALAASDPEQVHYSVCA